MTNQEAMNKFAELISQNQTSYVKDRNEAWQEKYEAVKEAIEAGQSLDKTLKTWLNNNKTAYKKGTMPQDRVEQFESLNLHQGNMRRRRTNAEKVEMLNRFIEEHGRTPKSTETYEGFNLGSWVYKTKRELAQQTEQEVSQETTETTQED